jgi:hypothetical protein
MKIVMGFRGTGIVVHVRRCGENGNFNGVYGDGIFGACETFRENEYFNGL